jgi:hypothetical protein
MDTVDQINGLSRFEEVPHEVRTQLRKNGSCSQGKRGGLCPAPAGRSDPPPFTIMRLQVCMLRAPLHAWLLTPVSF